MDVSQKKAWSFLSDFNLILPLDKKREQLWTFAVFLLHLLGEIMEILVYVCRRIIYNITFDRQQILLWEMSGASLYKILLLYLLYYISTLVLKSRSKQQRTKFSTTKRYFLKVKGQYWNDPKNEMSPKSRIKRIFWSC